MTATYVDHPGVDVTDRRYCPFCAAATTQRPCWSKWLVPYTIACCDTTNCAGYTGWFHVRRAGVLVPVGHDNWRRA